MSANPNEPPVPDASATSSSLRLELRTAEQFTNIGAWLDKHGGGETATAALVRYARRAGVTVISFSHHTSECLPQDFECAPALILLSAVTTEPTDWPQLEPLAASAGYTVVQAMPTSTAEFYCACVDTAKEKRRCLVIEVGSSERAHNWSRALANVKAPGAVLAPVEAFPDDHVGAVPN